MHHDVTVGLTKVQAEYVRSLINEEAESVGEEIGKHEPCFDDGGKMDDLTEALEMCELLVHKFEIAIADGIRRHLNDVRRK